MPEPAGPHDPLAPQYVDDAGMGQEVRRTLGALAPWAVSISAHVLLVVLAMFLVWSTVLQQEEEPWSGEVALHETPNITPTHMETDDAEEREAQPPTAPTIPDQTIPEPMIPQPGANMPPLVLPDLPRRPGEGKDGRDPNGGPTSGILGPTGRQTVFVIDASGSLIDTFPLVINELKRLLREMQRMERERAANPGRHGDTPFRYGVVFFRDGEVLTQDRRGLRTAERDAVTRSLAWLDTVHPGGSTSPLPAIEAALGYRPDTVVILSDNITGHGLYEINADDLIDRVLDVRGDRRVRINTVQFLYPDPQSAYGRPGTLERLAEQTDGTYRFVTDRELNLR